MHFRGRASQLAGTEALNLLWAPGMRGSPSMGQGPAALSAHHLPVSMLHLPGDLAQVAAQGFAVRLMRSSKSASHPVHWTLIQTCLKEGWLTQVARAKQSMSGAIVSQAVLEIGVGLTLLTSSCF